MNILWINKITDAEYWRTTQLGLTGALRKKGHNVMLVMSKDIGKNKSTNNDIIYIPTIPSSLLSGLFFGLIVFFYFPFFIREKNPDVIIIDGTSVWLPFALTLKIFNIPLLVDIRTLPTKNRRPLLFNICLHFSKYIANGLTTITPELEKILRTEYGLQDKKIGIWPSGVSMKDFTKSYASDSANSQIDSNKFVLIHHGSYGYTRGVGNLITSIGELDASIRERIKLLIIGVHAEDQKEFLRLCTKMGVKEQVEIIPWIEYERISSYIRSSDVGIIPLSPDTECWQVSVPLKTLEYMAMEKPIVATSIPFHQRIFEKGKCGILIDANDPKTLANAITHLYQNREELDVMGKTGNEIVKNHYTWDIIAIEVEKFIKTILADFRNET